MSTFQISLAIAGGAVLAGVVVYNTLTSRRLLPKKPENPAEEPGSPGLDSADDRREPSMEGLHTEATDPAQDLSGLPTPERKPGLDAMIDAIAMVDLDTLVSGEAALAATPPTRRVGSKPFAIEGLNVIRDEWETPQLGERYSAFQVGVQLANRHGPLNKIEFSEFIVKSQAFADAVGGEPEFPDMQAEVERAREIDQFANDHDAKLSFSLRARHAAWSPGYVLQHAAKLGFVPGVLPGRLAMPSATPGLPPLLTLNYDAQAALAEDPEESALREIELQLDVPLTRREEQPFVRLREALQFLAQSMDGLVTDPEGRPVPEEVMVSIERDLEHLYQTLEDRDLAAGSPQTRRLFS